MHEFLIRSDHSYARRRVLERDRGSCALCPALCRHFAHYLPAQAGGRVANPDGPAWEMDHVVPVVEGGGECGLDNLRTLCVPCHRRVTRELRARMAARR